MKFGIKKWMLWAVLAASIFTISLSLNNTYFLSKISRYPQDYFNEIIKYELKSNSLKKVFPTADSIKLTKDVLEYEQLLCLLGENENFFISIKNHKYIIGRIEKLLSRFTGRLVKIEEGVSEVHGSSIILRSFLKGRQTQKQLQVLSLGKKGQLIELASYYRESLLRESCKQAVVREASLYWKLSTK